MKMTPDQLLHKCLLMSKGDVEAALLAYEELLQHNDAQFSVKDDRAWNRHNYPRDGANRFLKKSRVTRAAREEKYALELRESIPQPQRALLDAAVSRLNAGEAIHHPYEAVGLAVDKNDRIVDPEWDDYEYFTARYAAWKERKEARAERTRKLNKLTDLIRQNDVETMLAVTALKVRTKPNEDGANQVTKTLNEFSQVIEDIIYFFENSPPEHGTYPHKLRLLRRALASVRTDVRFAIKYYTSADNYPVLMSVCSEKPPRVVTLCEEIIEDAYRQIDYEEADDYEPRKPERPEDE